MSRYLTFVLGLALFTLSFTSFAKSAKLSVEDFSKGNDFSRVTISPDGNYVAAIKKHEGKNSLSARSHRGLLRSLVSGLAGKA